MRRGEVISKMAKDETGDPRRTVALLWGAPARTRPGPKPALDLDRIVRTAIEIADRDGVSALVMRRVAAELGVGTASLYTYVPRRQDLIALMLDEVAGYGSLPHTFPGGWRDQLEAWAKEDWAAYHEHPWMVQVATDRMLPGPNLLTWYDSALTVLADTGLTELEKVAAIETVDGFLRGMAWASAGSDALERNTELTDEDWEARRTSAMAELVDFTRFPALLRSLQAGVVPRAKDTFELGLQRVLDGIEALVDSRRPPP